MERSAFERFGSHYEESFETVYNFVYFRVGRDTTAAEDLVAETYLRAFDEFSSETTGMAFLPWILRIARRNIADHSDAGVRAAGPQDGLPAMLASLPDAQHELIVLKFIAGLENRDIGDIIDKKASAVRVANHRAFQALRTAHGGDPGPDTLAGALLTLRVSARPQFRFDLQRRIRKEYLRLQRESGALPSRGRLAGLVALAAVLLGIPAVAVYAYDNPAISHRSPLYLVKQIGESFASSIATSPEEQIELSFALAGKRLEEAKVLSEHGIVDVQTLAEAKANVDKGLAAARILPRGIKPLYAERIAATMRSHVDDLKNLSVVAQARTSEAIIVNGGDIVALTPTPPPFGQPAPSVPASPLPTSVTKVPAPRTPILSPHPSVNILNDIITSSESLTDPENVLRILESVDLPSDRAGN